MKRSSALTLLPACSSNASPRQSRGAPPTFQPKTLNSKKLRSSFRCRAPAPMAGCAPLVASPSSATWEKGSGIGPTPPPSSPRLNSLTRLACKDSSPSSDRSSGHRFVSSSAMRMSSSASLVSFASFPTATHALLGSFRVPQQLLGGRVDIGITGRTPN